MANGGLQSLLGRACGNAGGGSGAVDPRDREAAFEELLRLVMIYIRAGMGRRLRDHRESSDVCQSIAKSFVSDFALGKLRFETEAQLAAYLQRVVQSKLADLARSDAAAKRGGGARALPLDATGVDGGAGVGAAATPAGEGASADLRRDEAYERVIADLSEDEQAVVRLRKQGQSWEQIARILGKDAAALRQQFSRAQRRLGGGGGPGESRG